MIDTSGAEHPFGDVFEEEGVQIELLPFLVVRVFDVMPSRSNNKQSRAGPPRVPWPSLAILAL